MDSDNFVSMGRQPKQSNKRPQRARRSKTKSRVSSSSDRHYVRHNYHDHSQEKAKDSPMILSDDETMEDPRVKKRRGPRGGVSVPFPTKLHVMLSKVEEEGMEKIVSWQPHGRCFTVHDPKAFVEKIMPKYFRQSKLTSFQRQLNLYGFSRLTSGTDRGAYYHELFLRHRLFLCKRMTRMRIKGTGIKGKASPETEPDFYSMPTVYPDIDTEDKEEIDEIVAAAMEENNSLPPVKRPIKRQQPGKKKASIPKPVKKEAIENKANCIVSPKAAKDPSVQTVAIVTPEARRPVTSVNFEEGMPQVPNTATSAMKTSPTKGGFRLQARSFRNGGNTTFDTVPPSMPSNEENSEMHSEPFHSDDKLTFEGKQFHYLDSFAPRQSMDDAFRPQAPPLMQWTTAPIPQQQQQLPYASASMISSIQAFAPRNASNISLPNLLSSLQCNQELSPLEMALRGPFLTPSSSSSSLYGMGEGEEAPLDCIDPDTIFSLRSPSPEVDWNISEDVDIDKEFSFLGK